MTLPGLLLLAGLMPMLGWLVARAARVRWLERVHPDVLPLQAVLGTAVLTCTCALLSHAGLGQRAALPLLGLLAAGLLAWNLHPRLRRRGVPRARWSAWLPLAAALASAAVVGLLPVVWTRSINPFNDACYYDSVTDWLTMAGISSEVPKDWWHPTLDIVAQLRNAGTRLGTSYVQACLAATLGVSHALLVFYAVSCWGFLLLAGSLYALGRRVFRLRPWMAAAAVCTTVCVPASSSFALQAGFQAQAYGLTALVALLTVGAALVPRPRWTTGGLVLLGTLLAWQASVYGELLPVAAAVMAVWLAITFQRARARRGVLPWARRMALLAGVFLLVGNFELLRAAKSLPNQMTYTVGHHITATPLQWLGLVTGSTVYAPLSGVLADWNPLGLPAGPLLPLALCVVFLVRRRGRHLEHGAAAALLVLALACAWFGFVAPDPWSGTPPSTWSLFKLTQWLYPLVIVCAWGCIGRWLRGPRAARAAAALALLAVGAGLPMHVQYADLVSRRGVAAFAASDHPLEAVEELAGQLSQYAGQPLYIVTRPHLTNPKYVGLLAYLCEWSPTAGLWKGWPYFNQTEGRETHTDVIPTGGRLTLLCHQPLFPIPGGRALACKVVAVPAGMDAVLGQVSSPAGQGWGPGGRPFAWLTATPATLVVFAPRRGQLQLRFSVQAQQGMPVTPVTLRLTGVTSDDTCSVEVGGARGAVGVRLACDVDAGVNEIRLTCLGPPGGGPQGDDGAGAVRVAFGSPQLELK